MRMVQKVVCTVNVNAQDTKCGLYLLKDLCQAYSNMKPMLISWMIDDDLACLSKIDIVTIIDRINCPSE